MLQAVCICCEAHGATARLRGACSLNFESVAGENLPVAIIYLELLEPDQLLPSSPSTF